MTALAQDVRYALRALWRNPGFSVVVILTMGLGVGAVTAVYTVVDPLLLRPVPFHDPGSLYELAPGRSRPRAPFATPNQVRALRDHSQIFESVEAYRVESWSSGRPDPALVDGAWVTPGLFESLGVSPRVGRGFAPGESDAALISERFWRSRFGGVDEVLGQRLRLQHGTFTVVGVLGRDVRFPTPRTDVWLPVDLASAPTRLSTVARLRSELTFDEGNARLIVAAPRFGRPAGAPFQLVSLHWRGRGTLYETLGMGSEPRNELLMLLGAVGLVLLLTCANVASLAVSRTILRRRELTVRGALGAGRARLGRQLLTESLVWAAGGGGIGVLIAVWATGVIRGLVPPALDALTFSAIRPDWRMLLFAAVTAALSGLASGMIPALHATRQDRLNLRGLGPDLVRGHVRARGVLLMAQIALATVLTVGAGLMINSYVRLTTLDVGFDPDGLIVAEPVFREGQYAETAPRRLLLEAWAEAAAGDPRVTNAAVTTTQPLSWHTFSPEVPQTDDGGSRPLDSVMIFGWVGPGFFDVMGIPMLEGATFSAAPAAARPVIIGNRLARQLWGNSAAVGRRFRVGEEGPWSDWMTVVGVAGDVHELEFVSQENPLEVYLPVSPEANLGVPYLVARGGNRSATVQAVQQRLWDIAPDVLVRAYSVDELRGSRRPSHASRRRCSRRSPVWRYCLPWAGSTASSLGSSATAPATLGSAWRSARDRHTSSRSSRNASASWPWRGSSSAWPPRSPSRGSCGPCCSRSGRPTP